MTTQVTKWQHPSRYAIGAVSLVLILTALGGCATARPSGVIILSAAESTLPKCTPPTSSIEVKRLSEHKRASCDLEGITVAFPDGQTLTAPGVSASTGFQSKTGAPGTPDTDLQLTNLGIYGLVASSRTPEGKVSWWGTPHGIALGKNAHWWK